MCQLQVDSESNKLCVKNRIMRPSRKGNPNLIYDGIRKLLICLNFVIVLQFCFNKESLSFRSFLDKVIFIWHLFTNNIVGREEIENRDIDKTKFVMI